MKTVKNISEQELAIPEVGVVKSNETISVPDDFHNANFEVVKSKSKSEEPINKVESKE
jgi:hypothetical protein